MKVIGKVHRPASHRQLPISRMCDWNAHHLNLYLKLSIFTQQN